MTRTTTRFVRLASGLLAGALLLTGCSGAGEGSEPESNPAADSAASESAAFNDSDIAFVQGMIPHHRGALEMAQLAERRAQDPRVLDLARRIAAAQQPEIEMMTGWLEEWGEPLPQKDENMGGMDHGSGDSGMEGMSDEDLATLEAASGTEFDRLFLEMMIEHHRGAVEMAETEIAKGTYPDAVAMAQEIADSQTTEIEEMDTLLGELGG